MNVIILVALGSSLGLLIILYTSYAPPTPDRPKSINVGFAKTPRLLLDGFGIRPGSRLPVPLESIVTVRERRYVVEVVLHLKVEILRSPALRVWLVRDIDGQQSNETIGGAPLVTALESGIISAVFVDFDGDFNVGTGLLFASSVSPIHSRIHYSLVCEGDADLLFPLGNMSLVATEIAIPLNTFASLVTATDIVYNDLLQTERRVSSVVHWESIRTTSPKSGESIRGPLSAELLVDRDVYHQVEVTLVVNIVSLQSDSLQIWLFRTCISPTGTTGRERCGEPNPWLTIKSVGNDKATYRDVSLPTPGARILYDLEVKGDALWGRRGLQQLSVVLS